MADSNMTKELLDRYYDRLTKKGDWGSLLSDDFFMTGTVVKESRGREAYMNNNFFRGVLGLKVKNMIIEGDSACAIVNYDLVSPKGNRFDADVAEIWKARGGKLISIAVYFDTAYFQKSMS
ncbi:MAG: nuclear transport factor 2 family protein [Candidatus Marsarchaeota archaeon]|nr:nuclear transport factor 2 family protein [Candidatus Marsarchaeota archaeon]